MLIKNLRTNIPRLFCILKGAPNEEQRDDRNLIVQVPEAETITASIYIRKTLENMKEEEEEKKNNCSVITETKLKNTSVSM